MACFARESERFSRKDFLTDNSSSAALRLRVRVRVRVKVRPHR